MRDRKTTYPMTPGIAEKRFEQRKQRAKRHAKMVEQDQRSRREFIEQMEEMR